MAAFVQTLFTGTAGVDSIIVLSGSKTVTEGNHIYVLIATSSTASGMTCVDNLGNTYVLVHQFEGPSLSNSNQHLWHAEVTVAGTLTSQTLDWTNSSGIGIAAGSVEFTDAVTPAQTATNSSGGSESASLTIGSVSGVLLWTHASWKISSGMTAYTPPSGYTNAFQVGGGGIAQATMDYKIGSASGSLSSSWTNSVEWTVVHTDIAGLVVFRPKIFRYYARRPIGAADGAS